ncbi:MAG: mannosyl-glycoprotein endo-beta-N-acetylglucosamidase [Bacteroidetes bacterium]|nr:MAG: mannosyl-glycoprotein endo-beta-N-acetylglucosamidase [Bacteroidota bacterium]
MGKYWFQLVLIAFAFHIFLNKNIQIQVSFNDKTPTETTTPAPRKSPVRLKTSASQPAGESLHIGAMALVADAETKPQKSKWKSADFKNLTFIINPEYAEKEGVPRHIVEEKLENCRKYVERFARLAMTEQRKFAIPASITLAQALLESDAGASRLATESNNHFGIKCRAKCRGCTCRNYSDDDVYDMFRVFDTAWASFREHSILLSSERYQKLKHFGSTDYKSWAYGLQQAGYATDKKYAQKLIQIIEALDLYQFDK